MKEMGILNREKQKKLKELKNSIMKIVKANIKPYGFRTKDGFIWHVQNGFFFTMTLFISCPDDENCNFYINVSVKPMYADNLFWDIMDMRPNKDEPLSLRAVGAFALSGVPVIDKHVKMEKFEISALEELVKDSLKTLSDLLQQVKDNEEDWFYAEEKKHFRYYQDDALRLMMLLHFEKYTEAMDYIRNSDNDSGGFVNAGKSLYENVNRYCRQKS